MDTMLSTRIGVLLGGPAVGKTKLLAAACRLLECEQVKASSSAAATGCDWRIDGNDAIALLVAPTRAGAVRLCRELHAFYMPVYMVAPGNEVLPSKCRVIVAACKHAELACRVADKYQKTSTPWAPLLVGIDDAHATDLVSCLPAIARLRKCGRLVVAGDLEALRVGMEPLGAGPASTGAASGNTRFEQEHHKSYH